MNALFVQTSLSKNLKHVLNKNLKPLKLEEKDAYSSAKLFML